MSSSAVFNDLRGGPSASRISLGRERIGAGAGAARVKRSCTFHGLKAAFVFRELPRCFVVPSALRCVQCDSTLSGNKTNPRTYLGRLFNVTVASLLARTSVCASGGAQLNVTSQKGG